LPQNFNLAPLATTQNQHLPQRLRGKKITFTESGIIGQGSNAAVCRLTIDGLVSPEKSTPDEYVGKYAFLGNEKAQLSLEQEIKINQQIRNAIGHDHPNLGLGIGSVDIDGIRCMLMHRINGPSLKDWTEKTYNDYLNGKLSSQEVAGQFGKIARDIMSGLVALHENGFVMNDLNIGNVRIREMKNGVQAVVIDFGCAGMIGQFKQIGLEDITPPERFLAHDDSAPSKDDVHKACLTPHTDAYSAGAILYFMVHRKYPSWIAKAADGSDRPDRESQQIEKTATIPEFMKNGTLFPKGYPLEEDLHADSPEKKARESELRAAFAHAGFYKLVEKLMHPATEHRLTPKDALEHSLFLKTDA